MSREKSKKVLELHSQVEKLKGHLAAAEILSAHANLSMPIFKLRDMCNDSKASFMALTLLARSLPKK